MPKEDFFTEVFAFIAEKHPRIVLEWLSACEVISRPDEWELSKVNTQESFQAPVSDKEWSGKWSRIDAVLRIHRHGVTDKTVVFLESKLDSSANNNQLPKYVDILKDKVIGAKWLLFVTREFELINELEEPLNLDGKVEFKQLRWHQFYEILQKHVEEPFIAETIEFMKRENMNRVKIFTREDVTTIGNFKGALSVMEATLDGDIEKEFKTIMGEQIEKLQNFKGLVNLGRYAWMSEYPPIAKPVDARLMCALGYFASEEPGMPLVGIRINIFPEMENGKKRSQFMALMEEFAKRVGWVNKLETSSPEVWSRIELVAPLQEVLTADKNDHVGAVREFFRLRLAELKSFKLEVSECSV